MTEIVFQTGWYNSYYCQGSPDTIIVFNESNPTPIYNVTNLYDNIPFCGSNSFDVYLGCCISSLDLTYSFGYQSFTRNYLSQYTVKQSTPKDMPQSTYCLQLNQDYTQRYYLENEKCLEGNVKCSNSTIYIFDESNCQGNTESYALAHLPINVTSGILGNVTLSMVLIENGDMAIQWLAFAPPNLLVPNYTEPLEYVMLLFFITALCSFSVVFGYQVYSMYIGEKRRDVYMLLISMFWAFRLSFSVYYDYTVFDDYSLLTVVTFILLLADVGTLLSGTISCFMLYNIFKVHSKLKQTVGIILLVIVHLICEIPIYLYYCPWVTVPDDINVIATELRATWKLLSVMLDISPVIIIFLMILRASKLRANHEETTFYHFTNKLYSIMYAQVLTGILYLILFFADCLFAKSDRQLIAIDGIDNALLLIHQMLLVIMYDQLEQATRNLVNPKSDKQVTKVLLVGTPVGNGQKSISENETVKMNKL
ncbi:hypothetical protein HDV06_006954 [Boothiomyces sp. JEL0866]|nr:hypothetical protein HDV06_006954 [Boothiomyces sp. JEL0866]